jgi:hypothetical protein
VAEAAGAVTDLEHAAAAAASEASPVGWPEDERVGARSVAAEEGGLVAAALEEAAGGGGAVEWGVD